MGKRRPFPQAWVVAFVASAALAGALTLKAVSSAMSRPGDAAGKAFSVIDAGRP